MSERILDRVICPSDLKCLTEEEMKVLAQEIRVELIASTSVNGGHLAPSLGAVELILGAHRALDAPIDRIVFDVGHQSYAHKIITGRDEQFCRLRVCDGLSGFPKREESEYDTHDAGHASDSLATALGLAIARDLDGGDEEILVIIGDASISGGLAFEGLNEIGHLQKKIIIILNDNEMSISPSVGAFSTYLAHLRSNPAYFKTRDGAQETVSKMVPFGDRLVKGALKARDSVKQFMVPGMFFEELGIKYFGPIDGHNLALVEDTVKRATWLDGPVLIHAVTTKGKGYLPAEESPEIFHGVAPFDPGTGEVIKSKGAAPSFTSVFADELIKQAEKDRGIVTITAAMPAGTGLDKFADKFPDRMFDVGIAEEAAVTIASGLALGEKKPVLALYSTFLQRGYDEIIINVCLQEQHVIFAIDRAGLVGEDGPTHHGVFDMAYLRLIPNIIIVSPSDEAELADAVATAVAHDGPIAVRYPRGSAFGVEIPEERTILEPGVSRTLREGADATVLAIGRTAHFALQAADMLSDDGYDIRVVDMRWVKPLDLEAIRAAADTPLIIGVEEGTLLGGFTSAISEVLVDEGIHTPFVRFGIPDEFVEQGAMGDLLERVGLAPGPLAQRIRTAIDEQRASTRG